MQGLCTCLPPSKRMQRDLSLPRCRCWREDRERGTRCCCNVASARCASTNLRVGRPFPQGYVQRRSRPLLVVSFDEQHGADRQGFTLTILVIFLYRRVTNAFGTRGLNLHCSINIQQVEDTICSYPTIQQHQRNNNVSLGTPGGPPPFGSRPVRWWCYSSCSDGWLMGSSFISRIPGLSIDCLRWSGNSAKS